MRKSKFSEEQIIAILTKQGRGIAKGKLTQPTQHQNFNRSSFQAKYFL